MANFIMGIIVATLTLIAIIGIGEQVNNLINLQENIINSMEIPGE